MCRTATGIREYSGKPDMRTVTPKNVQINGHAPPLKLRLTEHPSRVNAGSTGTKAVSREYTV